VAGYHLLDPGVDLGFNKGNARRGDIDWRWKLACRDFPGNGAPA